MTRLRSCLHLLLALLWLGQSALVQAALLPTAAAAQQAAAEELPPCHRPAPAQAQAPATAAQDCCCPGEQCSHGAGACPMMTAAAALTVEPLRHLAPVGQVHGLPAQQVRIRPPDPRPLLRPPSRLHG